MMHLSDHAITLPKKKLAICIFNRATYARCKSVIKELSKFPHIDLTVILSSSLLMEEFGNAAQEYIIGDSNNVHIELIDTGPNLSTGLGICRSSSRILDLFSSYFHSLSFDAVIVVADRFETLPAAMAASYQNIPVIHIQGGETTGNIDDRVRHAVTKIADYHFAATELSKEYILHMGEDQRRVHQTGCPSIDLIFTNKIKRWHPKEKYILCIFHPETENVQEAYDQTKTVLESVLEYCMQFGTRCYWYYPNPDPGRAEIIGLLDSILSQQKDFLIKAINKDPVLFMRQLAGAQFIIGNSSCGIRESSFIGLPAIDIGDRQLYRERASNVITVKHNKEQIKKAMIVQLRESRHKTSYVFGIGKAGKAIAHYISKMDFMLKGTLTYPFHSKFKERHFGEGRFELQKKRHRNTSAEQAKRKSLHSSAEPSAIPG